MNLLKILIYFALSTRFFCFVPLLAQAKDLEFTKFSLEHGLPGANVWTAMQDYQGFIWVTTGLGLARFDGRLDWSRINGREVNGNLNKMIMKKQTNYVCKTLDRR